MLLKGATLVELEPAAVEVGDLRVEGARIVARGASLSPVEGEEVISLVGRVVLAGFVSASHRMSATALRGFRPAVGLARARLEALEEALGPEGQEATATAVGLEGLINGTTTVFGAQSAGKDATSTLERLARGLSGPGLRAVLSCEVSDRFGALSREAAIAECLSFAQRAKGRVRGALGATDLATLSDEALKGLATAQAELGGMLSLALARDSAEEAKSTERFGKGPVERLVAAGLVGPKVILSPAIHLTWPTLSQLLSLGPWMVHTGRANMASQVGLATPAKFGVRACLGTDVMPLDVLSEAQSAALRSLDAGQPLDLLRFLANGQRLATEAFGFPVGPLREGAAADLLVLDYDAPSPLDAGSLASHLLFGMSSRDVESVMIDGMWRLWKRRPLAVETGAVMRAARDATSLAWQRLGATLPEPPSLPVDWT